MADQWGAGERKNWHNHGTVMVGKKRYPLIGGEHPHSRSDNRHYVEMDHEVVSFSGHRILLGVKLTDSNYLKESHLSGDDVRKGGSGEITADGVVVFEFGFRDIGWALRRAGQLIDDLSEHPSGWLMKDEREKLVGRKVFYRERAAIIERLVTDQGCVIIKSADGQPFPPPVYRESDEADDEDVSLKTEVTDPHIWWFREDGK